MMYEYCMGTVLLTNRAIHEVLMTDVDVFLNKYVKDCFTHSKASSLLILAGRFCVVETL